MSPYRSTTLAAAGATLLATAPLAGVFRNVSWMLYAAGAVVVVLGAALATRALRTPPWAQALGMFSALVLLLSWLFGGGTALLGVLPTPSTVVRFLELLSSAGNDTRELAAPVPDTEGLLFVVALSVGLMAILIDAIAVLVRQPALAGLPMLAIYSVPVAVLPTSVSWLSFCVAAAGYLWLLVAENIERVRRWGRRFTGDGRDVDIWESSPLAATGRRLGFVGIVVAVLIPLAVPGMTSGLLEQIITQSGFGTGPGAISGRMIDPVASLQGNLTHPERRDLLRVYTNDPSPGYLRLVVPDRLTAEGASAGDPDQSRVVTGLPFPDPPAAERDDVHRTVHTAEIEIIDLWQAYLPTYANTRRLGLGNTSKARWFYDDDTAVVWSARSGTRSRMRYGIEYVRYDFTVEQLRAAEPVDTDSELYRRNTEVPRQPEVAELVDQLTAGLTNQYDRTLAIHRYFSRENGFSYSEQVPPATSESAIVSFLENKTGFCQQYATAMTWMLRTAGIPSRVVIGFTQGTREADGFVVSNWDAHAWVEVYFEGLGWVMFDPTPASEVNNDVQPPWAPNPYLPQPEASASASANPGGSVAASPTGPRRPEDPGQESGAATGRMGEPPARWPYWLAAGLLTLTVLAAPGLHREAIRRRRFRAAAARPGATGSIDAAYAAWDELLDTLADLKIRYAASDTPRGVAKRLVSAHPPWVLDRRGDLDLLAHAAERATYSTRPLASDRLVDALSAVLAELRTNTTKWERLRARVFPPSVLQVWRERAAEAQAELRDGWQRWRTRMARLPWRKRSTASS